jgi:hypothetical protein
MSNSTVTSPSTEATTTNSQTLLVVVVSIGGVIITASIIIIVVVAVFVRKSTRELKQQTRSNQNRPHGPRPAHATSVRVAQGQRAEVIRGQPEAHVTAGQDPKDMEKAQVAPDEIQGFYAFIPPSNDLGSSTEGQANTGTCEPGIVYADLELFNDVAGKPGKPTSEETGSRPLTGPSVVVPSSQPDTYVEMEPLVASIKNDSAPVVECYPTGGIYDLAKDPDAGVSTRGFPPEQTDPGLYQNLPAADKSNETLLQTDM